MDLQEMAIQCMEDSERWFGQDAAHSLTITALGLCGESGEVADIVKKMMRGSVTMDQVYTDLCVEVIDVLIYLCKMIVMLHINVEAVYNAKRAHNEQRFGSGSDESVRADEEPSVGEGSE